jgi:hypothetical protein
MDTHIGLPENVNELYMDILEEKIDLNYHRYYCLFFSYCLF